MLMRSAISLLLFVGFAYPVAAQTTVSTPIVGFQKTTAPVGLSPAGFPLLNSDTLKVTTTSLTGNALGLAGQSDVGALLTTGEPYYVEVYTGSLKGDRFDVDTAATISAANGTVVLNSGSANNTYSVASIGNSLDGVSIAIRKHFTLDQLRISANPAFAGNNSALSADQVQFFNPATGGYEQYFLRGDGVTWRKVGTTDSGNKVPIPPGVGVFILRKNASTEITTSGAVRQNDFAKPYGLGLQLTAQGFPVDGSPSSLGMTAANGWTGNNSALSADQIQIYNPSSGGYDQYFLRSDGITWRKVGTTDAYTTNQIISSAAAVFISRKSADAQNVIVNPIAP